MNEFKKREKTKEILKDFLSLVAEDASDKNNVVKCQALIYSNEKGNAQYFGSDENGLIYDKNNNIKVYKLRQIVGLLLTFDTNVLSSIQETIEILLKKVSKDFNIEQKNVIISITTNDKKNNVENINITVCEKNVVKQNIDMNYIFPEIELEDKN